MTDSITITNIGEFKPEDGTNTVTFKYKGELIRLEVPTSEAINEDAAALKGWSLTVFKRYLKGEKHPGY